MESICHPNRVIVDLSAVAHNAREIQRAVTPGVRVLGVVKSDAYGHGLIPAARTLQDEGIPSLAVAYIYEAIALREAGIGLPVVILCGILNREESRRVVEDRFVPVVYDTRVLDVLGQEAQRLGCKTPVYIKMDTGMGRLGLPLEELASFLGRVRSFPFLVAEGLLSHLAVADQGADPFNLEQVQCFQEAIRLGRSMGFDLPFNSLANSAALTNMRESWFSMVRPGILLYGGLPCPDFACGLPLRPAMALTGQVLQIRDFPDHASVSYGRTHFTHGPRKMAVLSAGYADGLPRGMSNRGQVLIHEKRAPIAGTICMNLTICDVTDIPWTQPGDEVVFLGAQGRETILADDMARWANTISYEICCSIGRRQDKEYRT